jgi:hypothetical protein
MNQKVLRERLINYLDYYGAKNIFVANQINVCCTTLCNFRKNKLNLWETTAMELDRFLRERNS